MPRIHGEIRAMISRTPITLICDINALCLIEEALDGDIGAIMGRFDRDALTLSEERVFLFALLSARQPDSTLALAGDLMSDDIDTCRAKISEAILAALPEASPGKKPMAGVKVGLLSRICSWLGRRRGSSLPHSGP